MSLETKRFYDFADFRVDPDERVLLRDGVPLPLTPKAFHMLLVLVENHGRIVEKEKLMTEIWADSFVEEGSLSVNARKLRQALDDNASEPRFIETIPRRGYRFIFPIETDKNESKTALENAVALANGSQTKNGFRISKISAITFSVLLLAALIAAAYFLWRASFAYDYPLLAKPYEAHSITTSGDSFHPTLSRDGRLIAYAVDHSNRSSVRVRDIERNTDREIVPITEGFIGGLTFSPDALELYFARATKIGEEYTVYRVSIFGGTLETVVRRSQGWISISPDGEIISFVRCPYEETENCSLWTANAKDGSNERKIINKPEPYRIGDNEFSPDGSKLAFVSGQSRNGANQFLLYIVDLSSGQTEQALVEPFFIIGGVAWLPDGRELLIAAKKAESNASSLYRVKDDGSHTAATDLASNFSTLTIDADVNVAVTSVVRSGYEMFEYDLENSDKRRNLGNGTAAVYTESGKMIFASERSGNSDIWTQESDGTGIRQLTTSSFSDESPLVSPNGSIIYFASNRSGQQMIWSMKADGSEQNQLTQHNSGQPFAITNDGVWVYFRSSLTSKLWRVNTETREEQLVWDDARYRFGVSPNGSHIVAEHFESNSKMLGIFDVNTKQLLRTLPLNGQNSDIVQLFWNNDADAVSYILREKSTRNYTVWKHSLADEKSKQIADLGSDSLSEPSRLFFSKDGTKLLACQGDWKHDVVLIKGLRR